MYGSLTFRRRQVSSSEEAGTGGAGTHLLRRGFTASYHSKAGFVMTGGVEEAECVD